MTGMTLPHAVRFVDGKPVPSGTVTRAELLGQGLFETMRWQGGLPLLPWHLARLRQGAAKLGYNPDLVESLFQRELETVTGELLTTDRCVVRYQLSHTQTARGYATKLGELTSLWQLAPAPDAVFSFLPEACFDPVHMPDNAGTPGKFTDRIDQVWSADRAQGRSFIRCDRNGFVREGISGNLFFHRAGLLYTPNLAHWGVEGSFRAWLIAHWRKRGLPVITGDFRPESLLQADAVWLCNAVSGVQVVSALGATRYNTGLPIIKQLEHTVNELFYENP